MPLPRPIWWPIGWLWPPAYPPYGLGELKATFTKGSNMANITATWAQDTDPNVAPYSIFFTTTSAGSTTANPTLTLSVPRSSIGDSSGYSATYSQLTPTPPALNNGDSVIVTGESIDTFGQASPMVTASGSPVVISIAAPPTGPVALKAVQS